MAIDNPKKKYRYVGISTDTNDHIFDMKHLQELVDERRFQEAYDYGMSFAPINPLDNVDFEFEMKSMLRNGRVSENIYTNLDESAHPALDFKNAVMEPGGLDKIPNNKYAIEFEDYKNKLGEGAHRLQIRFEPQKRYGFLGLDWTAADNDYANIDTFYEKSGLNRQYLENNGVEVKLKDGYTYLEFDKSNDLANKILLNLPAAPEFIPKIYGIKYNGDIVDSGNTIDRQLLPGTAIEIKQLQTTPNFYKIYKMKTLYQDAKDVEEQGYINGAAKVKQYSTTVFPLLYDKAQSLEDKLNAGNIKTSDFNSRIKRENEKLIDGISLMNFADYEIQSNYFTDSPAFDIIEDQEQKQQIKDRFDRSERNKIDYGVVIGGDLVGLLVKLPPILKSTGEIDEPACEFMIFGEDVNETLQHQIFNDPRMQAYQEVNDMQDLGYTYKDINDNSYKYDGLGHWIVNGEQTNKSNEYIVTQLHKNIASNDIGRSVALENISVNGVLVNPNKYYNQLRLASIIIANDVMKNGDVIEAIREIFGDKVDYTDANSIGNAIFSLKGAGDCVAKEYEDSIANPLITQKLNNIYELYTNMKKVGTRYIRDYNEK